MFENNCDEATRILKQLDEWAHNLEEGYLLLEGDTRVEDETALIAVLTRILNDVWVVVQRLHSQHLPLIGEEEPNVAYAIQLAADELTRRVRDVQNDLEHLAQQRNIRRAAQKQQLRALS